MRAVCREQKFVDQIKLCAWEHLKNVKTKRSILYFVISQGAHTLGRARTQASGYNGPWVRGGQNDLDNRFYIGMRDRNWVQVCRLLRTRFPVIQSK